jgi:membrane-bound lytic murein transglycosylase A
MVRALALALLALVVTDVAVADPQCKCGDEDTTKQQPQAPPHDELRLTRVKFADVPGWADDRVAEAVPAFVASCAKLDELKDGEPVGVDGHGGTAKQWRHACAAARALKAGDDVAARAMFESEFVAYAAAGKQGATGKLTAYNVTLMRCSRTKHGKYKYPILKRPPGLVMVDLGLFTHDAHGRHIWGRVDKSGELQPMATRAEIRKGALDADKLELMYADDPVDVLFSHIEGSAKATLDDGTTVWLEFDGKNGRAYKGVGAVLKDKGLIEKGQGTMQGIRKWLTDHPDRFDEIVDDDSAYVFFKESKQPGAVGSQKVILTTKRSLAVDRAYVAASTPVFVDTRAPVAGKQGSEPWQHLLVAQDTGGGILGPVRGDIYWGDDRDAEEIGGRMGANGRYWLLLPKGVTK